MGIVTTGLKRFRESKWDFVKMKKLNDQTRGERTAQELEAGRNQIPWVSHKKLGREHKYFPQSSPQAWHLLVVIAN